MIRSTEYAEAAVFIQISQRLAGMIEQSFDLSRLAAPAFLYLLDLGFQQESLFHRKHRTGLRIRYTVPQRTESGI